jgi:hypothetical protein
LEEVTRVADLIHINSSLLSFYLFHVSGFMFHVSGFIFQVSYFKNISGMNSVDSLSKMFDRTSGWINRSIDCLSWMNMGMSIGDGSLVIGHGLWIIGDGAGCGMLEIGGERFEVGGGGNGRQFDSHQLTCAFLCLCFMFYVLDSYSYSYFKNISSMNSVDSLGKMFDITTGWINRSMNYLSWMNMGMSMSMGMSDW